MPKKPLIVIGYSGLHCPRCRADGDLCLDVLSGWYYVCPECGLSADVEMRARFKNEHGRWQHKAIVKHPGVKRRGGRRKKPEDSEE
jgi:hypothetical protein